MKIVRAIRNGWIKPKVGRDEPKYYLLWGKEDVVDYCFALILCHVVVCEK